jgi:hypothetical protein
MTFSTKTIFLFLILTLPAYTHACDCGPNFGTKTGTIYPEEKVDSIHLIKTRLHINLFSDSAHVTGFFWLHNSGSGKTIAVMFPNYQSDFLSTTKPVENFSCKVNGMPEENIGIVTLATNYLPKKEPYSGGKKHDKEKKWYTWEIHFEQNDTIKIEIQYDGQWAVRSCEKYFECVIGTPLSWDGPIKDGRIVFDHSGLVSTNYLIKNNETNSAGTASQAKKLKCEYFEDSTVYSFNDYSPKPDESLHIGIFTINWHPIDNTESNRCPDSRYVSSAQKVQAIRNEFYALHGFAFTDAALAQYYKKRKWYKISSPFDSTKLSAGDKKFLSNLSGIEKTWQKK